jgi:hypothetical protein
MMDTEGAVSYAEIFLQDYQEDYEGVNDELVDIATCASNLVIIDLNKFGYDEWKTWNESKITDIFLEVFNDAMDEILDTIDSYSAGEELIDEVLGGNQTYTIDHAKNARLMKNCGLQMMSTMGMYMKIKREILAIEQNF